MKRRKNMINILIYPKIPNNDPVLMKLTKLTKRGEEEEEVLSFMPDVPLASSPVVKQFVHDLFLFGIPSGYESYVLLHGNDCETVIDSKVILPSFNKLEARTLADRLEKFIEGEIEIIKNGY